MILTACTMKTLHLSNLDLGNSFFTICTAHMRRHIEAVVKVTARNDLVMLASRHIFIQSVTKWLFYKYKNDINFNFPVLLKSLNLAYSIYCCIYLSKYF